MPVTSGLRYYLKFDSFDEAFVDTNTMDMSPICTKHNLLSLPMRCGDFVMVSGSDSNVIRPPCKFFPPITSNAMPARILAIVPSERHAILYRLASLPPATMREAQAKRPVYKMILDTVCASNSEPPAYVLLQFFVLKSDLLCNQRVGSNILDPIAFRHVTGQNEVIATLGGVWCPVDDIVDYSYIFHPSLVNDATYSIVSSTSFYLWQKVRRFGEPNNWTDEYDKNENETEDTFTFKWESIESSNEYPPFSYLIAEHDFPRTTHSSVYRGIIEVAQLFHGLMNSTRAKEKTKVSVNVGISHDFYQYATRKLTSSDTSVPSVVCTRFFAQRIFRNHLEKESRRKKWHVTHFTILTPEQLVALRTLFFRCRCGIAYASSSVP